MNTIELEQRLTAIPWGKLSDAYGPAKVVPQLIQQLLSMDDDEREGARFYLYMGICHQECSIYSATAAAVPFLVELADDPAVQDRHEILRLLKCIVRADAEDDDGDSRAGIPKASDSFERVWRGFETFMRLAQHQDLRIAAEASAVLVNLLTQCPKSVPREWKGKRLKANVIELLQREAGSARSVEARVCFVEGLATLALKHSGAAAALDTLASQMPLLLRVIRILLLRRAKKELTTADRRTLCDAFAHLDDIMPALQRYREMADDEDSRLDEELLRCVTCVGSAGRSDAMLAVIQSMANAEVPTRTMSWLVELLFKKPPYYLHKRPKVKPKVKSFTPLQWLVLRAHLARDQDWPNDLFGYILAGHGIPNSRVELKQFLGDHQNLPAYQEHAEILFKPQTERARHDLFLQAVVSGIPDKTFGQKQAEQDLNPARTIREQTFGPPDSVRQALDDADYLKVEKLDLSGFATNRIVALAAKCVNVRELRVPESHVTNVGVKELKPLSRLRKLDLDGCSIGDPALRSLERLVSLERLFLEHTNVTATGVARLQKVLPKCAIHSAFTSPEPEHEPTNEERLAARRAALPQIPVNAELMSAIVSDRANLELREQYAVWLDAQPGPLGKEYAEFIRIQLGIESRGSDPAQHELARRMWQLLNPAVGGPSRADAWSSRAGRQFFIENSYRAEWARPASTLLTHSLERWEFYQGFVGRIRITWKHFLEHGEYLLGALPIKQVDLFASDSAKGDLARIALMPVLTRVRLLKVHMGSLFDESDLGALLSSSHLNDVWTLWVDQSEIGDGVARLVAAQPNLAKLQSLDLGDNRMTDAGAEALAASPYLRDLVALCLSAINAQWEQPITARGMRALADAPLTDKLECLILEWQHLGSEGVGIIAETPKFASLRTLNLQCNRLGNRDVETLARSPHLRLRRLSLAENAINDASAELLADRRFFQQLEVVDLRQIEFSESALGRLRERFGDNVWLDE